MFWRWNMFFTYSNDNVTKRVKNVIFLVKNMSWNELIKCCWQKHAIIENERIWFNSRSFECIRLVEYNFIKWFFELNASHIILHFTPFKTLPLITSTPQRNTRTHTLTLTHSPTFWACVWKRERERKKGGSVEIHRQTFPKAAFLLQWKLLMNSKFLLFSFKNVLC